MAQTDRPRVLVVQHLPTEGPGTIGAGLKAAGFDLVTVELDRGDPIPDLDQAAVMLVMGGPMDVWQEDAYPWLGQEKAVIRHWVTDLGRPFVGVCLGHQLLAAALGGDVGPMAEPEMGVHGVDLTPEAAHDRLFNGVPSSPIDVLQCHGAEVRQAPPGAILLATNETSRVQVFRIGAQAWGIQFHVEADPGTVAEWCQEPSYRAALEAGYPDGIEPFLAAIDDRQHYLERISAGLDRGPVALGREQHTELTGQASS